MTYDYDALERPFMVTSANGVALRTVYDDLPDGTVRSRVLRVERRSAGGEVFLPVQMYHYHPQGSLGAGRPSRHIRADGTWTDYAYDLLGRVTFVSGSGTAPLRYGYDAYGHLSRLDTFRTTPTAGTESEGDATLWDYDPASGLLRDKTDALSNSANYLYDPATARLASRSWSRTNAQGAPVTAVYSYDDAGRLEGITYNDGTPAISHAYHPDGRLHTTTDAAGLHTYHYDGPNGALSGESISGGLLDGAVLSYGYHASNHRSDEVSWSWAGANRSTEHGFDAAGRLESVSAFGRQALYGYDPVSGRRTSLAYGNGGPEGIWEYDSLDRLKAVKWKRGTFPLTRHVYGFDSMDRRRSATRETGEQWRYGYNSRGEVIHAVKARHGGEDAPLRPGMQTGYDHDLAGNRKTLEEQGSDGPLVAAWTANEGNQITEREILPERWVLGVAAPEAALQVSGHDGGSPQREGWEFAVPAAKAQAAGVAEWKELEITASRAGPPPVTTEKEGSLWFAASPESLTYDADGNLTGDGRWTYEWTAENRLAAMETRADALAAGAPGKRLEFAYDAVGRRVAKRVLGFVSSGGTMTLEKELRYLYDGWNMIAEFQMGSGGAPALLRAYAWGNDISSDGQQAGGVGGLVYVEEAGGVTLTPCYDGNGNVTAYVEGVSGVVVSKHDYGAFGEKVWEERRRAGELPPLGFSTKYEDEETGLLYYGYRYYSPEMGRWISRDPIGERGGINLYGMVHNDPVNRVDVLGRQGWIPNYTPHVLQHLESLQLIHK
ncbi:RHS repeat-associated core domain-containing protein [Prosthecobacter sp. SYSU 5D2]|uniref:RHS repeat-associated core domain-containing protein n=1 Tax=Prosthecobacter sp. SYSU 5D2 TaxID=3134134 RepID=UPI0031FEEA88